ncbi:MAG TPA: PEGA domain-containing protein [Verrucomicrobiae bacterium]|nr:PEGA domain-containing protein [Verrucomicrobiae bacterium]
MRFNVCAVATSIVALLCTGASRAQVYSSTSPASGTPSSTTATSQPKAKDPSQYWGTSIPPRVFITDSDSWEMVGASGGSSAGFAGSVHGGARPQTAEIIKTFGERCPEIKVNNIKEKADYIVVLDHEGGKGVLRHRNKVAVFARISGDSVASRSTLSLGGSVQDACDAINSDWALNGSKLRAAAAAEESAKSSAVHPPAPVSSPTASSPAVAEAKVSVFSTPDKADIEVDGSFMGNTPSNVQVSEGDHIVTVKKAGFKDWERKLKVTAGSDIRLDATLEAESPANTVPPSQQ